MAIRRAKDPIKAAARQARAQRRVGDDAACACGEKSPEALIAQRMPPTCYECDAKQRGGSVLEENHPAGRKNSSVKLRIPGNAHRKLSAKQYDWRKPMLENPEQDPGIAVAARIQGYIEMNDFLVEELLASIPDELCDLAARGKRNRDGDER